MTTANETPVPAWINLDVIAPPELRARLNAIAAEFEALEPTIDALARKAFAATVEEERGLDESGANLLDDVNLLIGPHTGYDRVRSVCRRIVDLVNCGIGENPDEYKPEWWTGWGADVDVQP